MSITRDFRAISQHSGSKVRTLTKTMFYCCLIFRVSHFFYRLKVVPIARFFWLINRIVFSIDIDPRANINGGLVILHGTGLVIGKSVVVNGDIKIYQGATLGGNNGKRRSLNGMDYTQPIIEPGVVIGINAAVLGPVVLGEGCQVGANAVITKDVPAKAIVVSNNKIINV